MMTLMRHLAKVCAVVALTWLAAGCDDQQNDDTAKAVPAEPRRDETRLAAGDEAMTSSPAAEDLGAVPSSATRTEASRMDSAPAPASSQADEEADLPSAPELLNAYCGGCHTRTTAGGLSRISNMRKTPEGWDMTIARMMIYHQVEVPTNVRRVLVKYLADRQGLAPAETASHRAVLERRHNIVETGTDEYLSVMCARCHSYARFALQRRNADEWGLLVNMHVGQWPSIEYQALARDRDWWREASEIVPQLLAEAYPLETGEWADWRQRPVVDISGNWQVTGHWPGKGEYAGTMVVEPIDTDRYRASYALTLNTGETFSGQSTAVVYTGYEWRGRGALGPLATREIYALSEDGDTLRGRWHDAERFEVGADFHAVRVKPEESRVLSVWPSALETGDAVRMTLTGINLEGDVDLGPGVKAEVLERTASKIVIRAKAKCDAELGPRALTVGSATGPATLTVYNDVDYIKVVPEYGIARLPGGDMPPVTAQFEAIGYIVGPDGVAHTDDDVRIGVVKAEWRVEPYTETAAAMKDAEFAGTIDDTGLFTPAEGGPNPARPFNTNNVGDLRIVASVPTYDGKTEAAAHLIVGAQKWNNPPLQ